MKIASILFVVLALGLIAFNITKIDFNNLFEGDSTIALIEIIAALIAITLLGIFTISKRIEKKVNQ